MLEHQMKLTEEEQAILDGAQGETMAKVMKTLVAYGDAFGAEAFVPVSGPGHLVTSFGISVMAPVFSIMDELIEAGLHTKEPFTVDPRPIDYRNVPCDLAEKLVFSKILYGMQARYETQLKQIGLKSGKSFTCTCYMDEVGNRPKRDDILSWAESSAVVYANSVLGARCNRNSALIELFGLILGKVPLFDLLTDEGRRASWIVEVKTSTKPEAQVLGSAIGMKVMEAVPYIRGLSGWLGEAMTPTADAYLKDMGAASASNGAVGLYHVEGLTPEAKDLGESLIREDARVYVIDDAELERIRAAYPVVWRNPDARPTRCFIGCPHLSHGQLGEWANRIGKELKRQGRAKVGMPVVMTAAPEVLDRFQREDSHTYRRLTGYGVRLSSICPLMYMNNPLCGKRAVITNSNKLRTYTSARYFTDDELVRIVVKGGF